MSGGNAVTAGRTVSGASRQLVLIPRSAADWRLDERTRETGRRGVAAAREALRLATIGRGRPAGDGAADERDDTIEPPAAEAAKPAA